MILAREDPLRLAIAMGEGGLIMSEQQEDLGGDEVFLVDLQRLEREAAEHARTYRVWASRLAKAKRTLRYAEMRVTVARADLADEMRRRPEKYGLGKSTVDAVKDAVTCHDNIVELLEAAIEAEYQVDELTVNVRALDHKKGGIEDCIKLQGQGYFATPRASASDRDAVQDNEIHATLGGYTRKVR